MELEEKLNEVRSSHGHQIDDILINQGQIRKVKLTTQWVGHLTKFYNALLFHAPTDHQL